MQVDNLNIQADILTILYELKRQLELNGISLFGVIKDGVDNVQVSCPYHKNGQERKPSGGFKKDTGIYHCFTCGTTKTLPELISDCFGKEDFGVFGTQWLIKNFVSIAIESRKNIQLNLSRDIHKEDIKYVSEEELDGYRYYHPYMYERKLNDKIINLFDIGYDSSSECITFPVRDECGNCLFVARRSVKTKYFNYPSGAKKPIYGLYELNQLEEFPKEVIICESMLDALVAWVWGKYAVALNGLGSASQFKELSKMPNRKFVLATDNDIPGIKARDVLRENIENHIITEYVLPFGKKDLNDLNEEEFKKLVEIF